MTDVRFYFNARDKYATAIGLAARAYQAGRRVALLGDDERSVRRLDERLWSEDRLAFLPHVARRHALAANTPIVLGYPDDGGAWTHFDVLINCQASLPPDAEQFALLLEIVATEESERAPARERLRTYRARGIEPTLLDLAKPREAP